MYQIIKHPAESIDSIVGKLLWFNAQGGKAYCDYDGVILFSDNVTIDSAYEEITGKNKRDQESLIEQDFLSVKRRYEQEANAAIDMINYYVEEGKKFIHPFLVDEWRNAVSRSCRGDLHGLDIKYATEIMSELFQGEELLRVCQLFDKQRHNDRSSTLVRNYVLKFYPDGENFYKMTSQDYDHDDAYILEVKRQNDIAESRSK